MYFFHDGDFAVKQGESAWCLKEASAGSFPSVTSFPQSFPSVVMMMMMIMMTMVVMVMMMTMMMMMMTMVSKSSRVFPPTKFFPRVTSPGQGEHEWDQTSTSYL